MSNKTIGVRIIVTPTSKKKLTPIKPKIRTLKALGISAVIPEFKRGWKNIKLPSAKIKVLTTGTKKDAKMAPIFSFLNFSNNLYTKLAISPASPVLSIQTSIVPIGDIGMNIAIVEGDIRANIPLITPSNIPAVGP